MKKPSLAMPKHKIHWVISTITQKITPAPFIGIAKLLSKELPMRNAILAIAMNMGKA